MKRHKCQRWLGFSLVELMAVVTIIGVLVALALPRFRVFIARARQGEAVHNLGIILKLQKSFRLRKYGLGQTGAYDGTLSMGVGNKCTDTNKKNVLGFRVPECGDLRYLYTSSATTSELGKANNNGGHAKKIYPECGSVDEWKIAEAGKISNDKDVVTNCAD